MGRSSGASATVNIKEESSYGTDPGGNYNSIEIVSCDIGMTQDLVPDPILGRGRDPYTQTRDVKTVDGDITVPLDRRNIGFWLSMLLGAPTTTQVAATGSILFANNPTAGDTITLNGVAWTFVASGATGNQTNIQGSLASTLATLVTNLNASGNASIDDATYSEDDTSLIITHDTAGSAGNAYTLAASSDTPSGATLTGGGYRHRFVSGGNDFPSFAIEVGHPAVPAYFLNLGVYVNSMALNFVTSGLATAVFNVLGQDEQKDTSSVAGTPANLNTDNASPFSNFQGSIKRNGVAIGNIEGASLNYSNNLDPLRVIRSDGLISGADAGLGELTGQLTARFDSLQLRDDADNDTQLELEFGYIINAHNKLLFTAHNARIPVRKQAISGPGGIRATYDFLAAYDGVVGRMLTVDLHNDYDGTLYPS